MTTLYLTEPYSTVRKDGDTLVVNIPENKETGSEKRSVRVPLMKVEQVVVMGDSTVTTPALLALLEQNAEVCFCDYWGRFKGRLAPEVTKNIFVRTGQFRLHERYAQRVALAKRFVRGKLHNQRTLVLRSSRGAERSDQVANFADQIGRLIGEVDNLPVEQDGPPDPRYPQAQSALGALNGLEGAGAAAFFGAFRHLLKQDLGFDGRHRRPPTDPINVLLSYGYTLLMNHVMSAVQIAGFDPYLGFLHSEGYGKPALALDLMEEMRTPIVDSIVMTVINKNILRADHFEEALGVHRLTPGGRKLYLQQFEQRLNTEIEHPVFKYKATYRRCLELQARLLAKFVLGEIPEYRPFQIR
jgi:CRISPR-associated protein Cas1